MDISLEAVPPPQLDVIDAVSIAARTLITRLDREVGVLDLTWAQARVLIEIAEQRGPIHAGEVGRRLGVSRQAAHRTMLALDRCGYLRWRDDGYVKSVRLTRAGSEAVAGADGAASGTYDALWRVDPGELHALVRGAISLRRELRRRAPEPSWWMD